MYPHVLSQVVGLRERLAACLADMWLLPRMCPHVPGQIQFEYLFKLGVTGHIQIEPDQAHVGTFGGEATCLRDMRQGVLSGPPPD